MRLYEALELEPKLALDPDDLQQRFYRLSRQWHPDRFSRAGATSQQQALGKTALLNEAFRTLRDPISRAEYFCREHGLEASKNPPPELLEEVFDLNMTLDELRGGDASVRPQLADAEEKFRAMLREIDESLARLFLRHDAGGGQDVLQQIRAALDRRRYAANLLRDVEKELHVHVSD
jgi:molecular chaperone HscB